MARNAREKALGDDAVYARPCRINELPTNCFHREVKSDDDAHDDG